jgi:biotin synthesis protein BioG
MKAEWLHRAGHPRLLVFFAGWGMDAAPFRRLGASRWDVLAYYDYRRLDEVPCLSDVSAYPEMALVAWSLGCAVGNRVAQEQGWLLSQALAINGTLMPEDEEAGIPARWMDATARNLSGGGWEKFVKRMCPDPVSCGAFDAGRPGRDLGGAVEELQVLRGLTAPAACVFRVACVSEADRIIAAGNQRRCWARYAVPVRELQGPHYPFHMWGSWEEVLACGG